MYKQLEALKIFLKVAQYNDHLKDYKINSMPKMMRVSFRSNKYWQLKKKTRFMYMQALIWKV